MADSRPVVRTVTNDFTPCMNEFFISSSVNRNDPYQAETNEASQINEWTYIANNERKPYYSGWSTLDFQNRCPYEKHSGLFVDERYEDAQRESGNKMDLSMYKIQ